MAFTYSTVLIKHLIMGFKFLLMVSYRFTKTCVRTKNMSVQYSSPVFVPSRLYVNYKIYYMMPNSLKGISSSFDA